MRELSQAGDELTVVGSRARVVIDVLERGERSRQLQRGLLDAQGPEVCQGGDQRQIRDVVVRQI